MQQHYCSLLLLLLLLWLHRSEYHILSSTGELIPSTPETVFMIPLGAIRDLGYPFGHNGLAQDNTQNIKAPSA